MPGTRADAAMGDRGGTLLFYCQHLLGIGHLVRSFAICEALTGQYRVVLACGGALPDALATPQGAELVRLPPISARTDFSLVSPDGRDIASVLDERRRALLDCYHAIQPTVVLIELYPFGRRKLGGELQALLEETRHDPQPLVVSSLRDILVFSKEDEARFRDQAVGIANDYFDAILVHTDSRVAPPPDLTGRRSVLSTPVITTGFVAPRRDEKASVAAGRDPRVVVSVGGGMAGEALLRAAVQAQREILLTTGLTMRVIGGPLVPDGLWAELTEDTARRPGVELVRSVPDLVAELAVAQVSVSQCGYNTALDLARARVPAVVVPFGGEDEDQSTRARRLEELGLVSVLPAEKLEPRTLAAAVRASVGRFPAPVTIDMDGAATTAHLVVELERRMAGGLRRPQTRHWLEPLRTALDKAADPVNFFFRDDDAGRGDVRLWALLDVFARFGVHVDLAVIPEAITAESARRLLERAGSSASIGFLQHGRAHRNHEPEGKASEFGPARDRREQLADISAGRDRLDDLLGPGAGRIFVPPWNRCSRTTFACLVELGIPAVSRDDAAAPPAPDPLISLDTAAECFRRRRGVPLTLAQLGRQLADSAARGGPVGVLTHHERMDVEERSALAELLGTVIGHDRARCLPMAVLLDHALGRRVAVESAGTPS